MDFRGLVGGAANVARGYRETEASLRAAEQERLNLQRLRMEQAARERADVARRNRVRELEGVGAPFPTYAPGTPVPQGVAPPQLPPGVRLGVRDIPPPVVPAAAVPAAAAVVPPTDAAAAAPQQPLTQAEQDRLSLLRLPAAALDVIQAPAAAGLNVLGSVAAGGQNILGRVVNAVTGEQTMPTDVEYSRYSLTPFYDRIRQAEAPRAAQPAAAQPAAAPTAVSDKARQYDAKQTPYDNLMQQAAAANGLDPVVFKRLIGTESSFNPNAVSPRGANFGLGIAQIAAVHGLSDEQRRDPNVAIPFAAQLFKQYLDAAGGDYNQAILRYKGASSQAGVQAMTPVAQTILGGTAAAQPAAAQPAAAQPAAAQPAAAAAAAAAAEAPPADAGPVATALRPGVTPEKVDFQMYAVEPERLTADQRYLRQDYERQRQMITDAAVGQIADLDGAYQAQRQGLVAEFNAQLRAGQSAEAQAARDKIVQLDDQYRVTRRQLETQLQTGAFELDTKFRNAQLSLTSLAAAAQIEYQNDPTLASQVMSYAFGQPIRAQFRSDGNIDMLLPDRNGDFQVRQTFSKQDFIVMLRDAADAAYRAARQQLAQAQALKVTEEQARTIREVAVARIQAGAKLQEITLEGRQYDLKPDGQGNVFLLRKDGSQAGIIRPGGNKIPGPGGTEIEAPPTIQWVSSMR